eukprot:scaffold65745_cov55-Attheya_sp.AAC.2
MPNNSIPRCQAFLKETSHTWQLYQWYQKTNVASSTKGATTASLGSVDVASIIPQKVSCETMGYPEHDSEGRIIAVDFPRFFWPTYMFPTREPLSIDYPIEQKSGIQTCWN